jgi:hypothetical protein
MTSKPELRLLVVGTDQTFRLAQDALGDTVSEFVNVQRLARDYGEAVAGEILCQVVISRLRAPRERAARRRRR